MSGKPAPLALETPRVRLRLVRPGDAAQLLAYYRRNREHLKPWDPARPAQFYTLEYAELYVSNIVSEQARGERASFLAFARLDGPPGEIAIAIVNLNRITRGIQHSAILGYSADALVQGKGLAREAVGAVVRHAFDVLALHRIEANYQPKNERSAKLLRAVGFEVEGFARDYLFIDGAWRDHVLTSITNPVARDCA